MTSKLFFKVAFVIALTFTTVNCQCYDNETGYFADDQQCDKYIECKDGKLVNVTLCPDGLVFVEQTNPISGSKPSTRGLIPNCQLPFNVDCAQRSQLQPPQPTAHCPRANGLFSHPTDCSKFYQCVNGKPFMSECASTLAFNPNQGNCDWSIDCAKQTAKALAANQPDDKFQCPAEPNDADFGQYPEPRYAHESSCKLFYICLSDQYGERTARLNRCAYGLVFNEETKSCESPSVVERCKNYNEEADEEPEEVYRRKQTQKQAQAASNAAASSRNN